MFSVDFIGLGVSKSATSWIHQCLKEHPQIYVPEEKETFFFFREEEYQKGISHYQSFFKNCSPEIVKGEFATPYFLNEKAPSLIKKHFPNVKLMVCLRNPIERVYSHYHFDRLRGKRPGTFEESLKNVPLYIKHGLYHTHLQRYLKFFPEVLVLIYEDIDKNPLQFIQRIYDFLKVDSKFVPFSVYQRINPVSKNKTVIPWFSDVNFQKMLKIFKSGFLGRGAIQLFKLTGASDLILFLKRKNVKGEFDKMKKPFIRPPMNPETKKYLQDIYQDEINNLEKLINRDLSFWKK